jgi:uncharacterized protein (DUF697 family)
MEANTGRLTRYYSGASAVAAFVTQPVPMLDELIVVPLQYSLCKRLARAHGISRKELPRNEIRKIIWYGAAARLLANFSLGLVPVVGMFSNAVTAIALTEFLSLYVEDALQNPERPPTEITMGGLKQVLVSALQKHATQGAKEAEAKASNRPEPSEEPAA